MTYEPPFQRTPRIDNLCMEIAELTGALTPSSPLHSAPKLHRELRIRTVHSSLVIEGNTLSAEIVTAIMDGKRVAGPEREICEVRNAQRAYELLPQLDPFSVADLLRAHHTMMAGLLPGAGNFRDKNAGVFNDGKLIHMGTPADYVPEVVTDLFDWMKGTPLHPLLASCIFHYEFEFIHPFADGNGRVGRLWHTLLLSHWRSVLAWLPVESVILSRQQEYYASFVRSNTDSSAEAFVTFMLEVIREALIPFATNLSPAEQRTEQALKFFGEHPQATMNELAEYLGCSKRSAERTVAQLQRSGDLLRTGSARVGTWSIRH